MGAGFPQAQRAKGGQRAETGGRVTCLLLAYTAEGDFPEVLKKWQLGLQVSFIHPFMFPFICPFT